MSMSFATKTQVLNSVRAYTTVSRAGVFIGAFANRPGAGMVVPAGADAPLSWEVAYDAAISGSIR